MASLATTITASTGSAAATRPAARASLVAVARPRSTLLVGPVGGGARAAVAARASAAPTILPRRNPRPTLIIPAAAATDAPTTPVIDEQPISLTPAAMKQLERLRREEGRDAVLLRMGVRAGGCSGMSYDMKFEDESNIDPEDDTVLEFGWGEVEGKEGGAASAPPLRVAVDGKSLLFLFGMSIDYSDALVGGGFKFINPGATDTCGCGKSFSA